MQLRRIVTMMSTDYAVPSLALNFPCKEYQIIYSIYYLKCSNLFVYMHAWETNTHARVNLYEMSTCKSCWSWSVSQFSICMSLLRLGFQGNSFWNSKTDSQMYTFTDQMNWQFVQILMDSKFHSKLRVLDTGDLKQNSWAKDFFVFCSGKICLVLFQGCYSFVQLRYLCPIHKINAQTPITTMLATHLLHEFIVNESTE